MVWLSDDFTNAGNLNLAMTITNAFTIIALYSIRAYQVSDINEVYSDSDYVTARLTTCAGAILLCAIFILFDDLSSTQRLIIFCYMIFRANEALIDVFHGIDQKHWRMDYICVSQVVRGVLKLITFVVLLWMFDLLTAIIGMTVITMAVGFLYDIPKAKKLATFRLQASKQIISLLKRCFPLMLSLLIVTAILSFARYLLQQIEGTEALGVYATATTPTIIIPVVALLIFNPLTKPLADLLNKKNKAGYLKVFALALSLIVGITTGAAVVSHFFGAWGLGILFDDSVVPYAYLLAGAAVAAGLTGLLWYMNVIFTTIGDLKGLFVCKLIGLIICLTTAGMFIENFGLIGTNYVMIVSQGVAALLLFIRLFWYINRRPELFNKNAVS